MVPRVLALSMSSLGLLVIVPCGKAKIWDRHPEAGPTPARDAYIGSPFIVNRRYAERFASRWVILSAKYGFIDPGFVMPGPYDVTFKRRGAELIGAASLRAQVAELVLAVFPTVVVLGGKEYRQAAEQAFAGIQTRLRFPFAGLSPGRAMRASNAAIARGDPFYRAMAAGDRFDQMRGIERPSIE